MIAPSALAEQVAPAAPESPYKGLVPFEDSQLDALLFFGREVEREVIAANLLASRLTVLYGPSGVGKSSLLRAGVAHRLRRDAERNLAEHGHPELAVASFASWSEDPVAAIRAAAEHALEELFGAVALAPADPGAELADVFETWTSDLGCDLLLILDQTEEYFLYHGREAGPDTFAEQLPELVTRPGLRVRVLLAVREDSLAALDFFKGRIPNLFANYLRLDHLDHAAGRRAILGPLERFNELASPAEPVTIEPRLVDAVLAQVEAGKVAHTRRGRGAVRRQSRALSRVEAPYLQLVMQRLWEVERAEGSSTLRLETLERLGGASRVTEEHLERALGSLTPAGRDVAARMFHHLVTPSGTKIAHRTADLAEYARVPAADVQHVVHALAGERILRPVDGRGNGAGAAHEIFHDVLADAVVAWRTKHDTDAQIVRERESARGRYRRFLAVALVALAGLAAMTVVAVYALAQRSEAREQAAAARVAQREALAQAHEADVQRREATRQTKAAERATTRAKRSAAAARTARNLAKEEAANARAAETDAEIQAAAAEREEARATSEAARATSEAARARTAEDRYRSEAAAATAARDHARRQTTLAEERGRAARRSEKRAIQAGARAKREARSAKARALTAEAETALGVDPAVSLRLALEASRLEPSARAEDVLRRAFLAMRVRVVLPGGGGAVTNVAFGPDDRLVATASEGGGTRLFRADSGRLVHVLRHPAAVSAVEFSPDGRALATAGRDGRARIWNVDTGIAEHVLTHPGPVAAALFVDGGRRVVTASGDGTVAVWDRATGLQLRTFGGGGPVRLAVVSPDGRFVLTLTGDRFARVFAVDSGARVATLDQGGEITSAAFAPSGTLVATTGRLNARVWNVPTWTPRGAQLEGHTFVIRAAAFSPDSRRLVTASADGTARIWRTDTGALIGVLLGHLHELTTAVFSPDGEAIATASRDHTARIFTGPVGNREVILAGHRDTVTSIRYSANGRLALTGSVDGFARVWDAAGDPDLATIGRHDRGVTTVSVSSDSRLVVSAGADSYARVWRAGGGLVSTLRHDSRVTAALFTTRGTQVLTASEDGTVRVWTTRGVLRRSLPHGAPVRAATTAAGGTRIVTATADGAVRAWAPDGRLAWLRQSGADNANLLLARGDVVVTAGGDGAARIWRLTDGRPLRTLGGHDGPIVAADLDRSGRRLVTVGVDGTGRLWDVSSGRELRFVEQTTRFTAVRFNPKGDLVVTADARGEVRSWNALTGRLAIVFSGHVSVVPSLRFSPDGKWLVTAGPSAAGVWQTSNGWRLYFLRGHTAPLQAAVFAPDGRRVVTGAADSTVRTHVCRVCVGLSELRRLSRERLVRLERANAAARGR